MADNARGIHVSPGIYSREVDVNYAVRSLGITTLGAVGETLKGPAFQVMDISNWREYQDIFGGTSTEKFRGSQYPKYELPYIAKSYLSESEQLKVVRVLGLSGYNAGPAWIVTASNGGTSIPQAVAVLRSRGYYRDYLAGSNSDCVCEATKYDTLRYMVGEQSAASDGECARKGFNLQALQIAEYSTMSDSGNECEGYGMTAQNGGFSVYQTNRGRFKIVGITGPNVDGTEPKAGAAGYFEYAVSLNPYDKDYILKVLGTNNDDGDAPVYVETLYDVALEQGIADGSITVIDSGKTTTTAAAGGLKGVQAYFTADYCRLEPVTGIVSKPHTSLLRKNIGERYVADAGALSEDAMIQCVEWVGGNPKLGSDMTPDLKKMELGQIYTVRMYTSQDGKRYYLYTYVKGEDKLTIVPNNGVPKGTELVLNMADGLYWRLADGGKDIVYVQFDMNDYKSSYRYASTPWIVSNLKGDAKHVELNRLFRFHTISDGNNANYEIKVSIENVRPDEAQFDVVIRRVDDTDESVVVLEAFRKCTMVPTDSNYIAYKIGSFDGVYETKSKYVTVEVNESTPAKNSVPAGFMGYPIPQYNGTPIAGSKLNVAFPTIKYNRYYDEDVKNKRQYFGLSSLVGVDVDNFTFKGNKAYIDSPEFISKGFHLDSRLDSDYGLIKNQKTELTVDGENGYEFESVSVNSRTSTLTAPAIIASESEMYGSIYEYVNLRKFTVYFYGGFDGWDAYRDQRTNTDKFKMSQYRGYVNQKSGEGYSFNRIQDPASLGLNQNGITSDWYAYLSGIRQFANPEANDINVFVTPGIDYVNNKLLVEEVIDMIEEERADSIYVVTTPDKPSGAGDYVDEMYTPDDVVANLEYSEIDSNYSCTYYPWVKYLDQDNNQYIYLPPTKDVVRNFAQTDNTAYPWFAPAGIGRGNVDCVRARFITKLADEDELYEGRINPVKTFAQDGPKIWGQKNLQINESQLNRIAVRRLLLRMRKLIAISCIGLIFEPNDNTVKQSFISTVTPIMESIRSNRGISDYRIEVDDSVESRDRRELPVKIFFKPYNALEYITIDFVLTPEGISFDDI